MGSPQTIDFDQLLAPISEDKPCGESLAWDPIHDEIKKARREESKDALDAAAPVQANWAFVLERARDALARRSKDLMIAGYLTEALVQLHGFAGLRDGLRVTNELLGKFWDGLYPQIDGDDLEKRIAPIVWFTEADRGARLPNRIRDIPLTPAINDGHACSWSLWKSRFAQPRGANEGDDAYARRKAEAEEQAKLFEDTVATVKAEYFVNLREDIEQSLDEVSRMSTLLNEKFGKAGPGTSALKQSLEECAALVGRILKDKGQDGGGAATETAGITNGTPTTEEAAGVATGPIRSRADALRRLSEVAAYFRQTEPHSPVSYLVQRAAAWGKMPLEELLSELVKDTSVRAQIGELLGFKRSTQQ